MTTCSTVRFSPQTMQWYHQRMASLSDFAYLVMAKIQISLIKQIRIGRPEHSLNLHPLRPIISYFYLTPHPPPPPSKWTSYVYHPYVEFSGYFHLYFLCWKYLFWVNLVWKFKVVSLSWNLIPWRDFLPAKSFNSTKPQN